MSDAHGDKNSVHTADGVREPAGEGDRVEADAYVLHQPPEWHERLPVGGVSQSCGIKGRNWHAPV
ncbi:MAG: hypothetical protein WCG52_10560 [bacterium]